MVGKMPAASSAKMPEPRLVGDAGGHEHGLVEHVGVDLIEHGVVLRDAAGVDDALDGDAVLGHALEDDAGVEGGAFDGGEELVLRGVDEVPAERDAAEFGIDEHGAVAVVPGEAQQAGLAGAIVFEALRELGDVGAGAACDGFEDVAGGGEAGFDAGVMRDARCRGRRRRRRERGRSVWPWR